jgi:hypothetical protein
LCHCDRREPMELFDERRRQRLLVHLRRH